MFPTAFVRAFPALGLIFVLSAAPASAQPSPVRIGVSLGLTGRYAPMSLMQKRGFTVWQQDVNGRGGLLGRPVELIVLDDGSEPGMAVENYRRLIHEEKADLLFAPFSSQITEAVLPLTAQEGYSLLLSGAAADRLWASGYDHVFGLFTPASRIAVTFLEFAVMKDLGRVAILYADDSFSQDVAAGSRKWAERYGLEVVLFEGFPKDLPDFDGLARRAREAGPEVLMVCGHLEEAVQMRLALDRGGWVPRAYYAPQGPGMAEYRERLRDLAEGTFSSSQWEYDSPRHPPGTAGFIAAYEGAYGERPLYFAVTAYAAGQILEAAVARAGSLDRGSIKEILAGLEAENIVGRYRVDGEGKPLKSFTVVTQIQGSRRDIVWPEDAKTREALLR